MLAILSVIQIHVTHEFALQNLQGLYSTVFNTLSLNTWFGMDLFFILSGYLIGSILLVSEDKIASTSYFMRFYIRRIFRIFPLYYVVLTLLVLALGLSAYQKEHVWLEYFYLSNYPTTFQNVMYWGWSLSVEEHFYLIIPFIILLLKRLPSNKSRLVTLALLWASGFAVRWYIFSSNPDGGWGMDKYLRLLYTPTHARYDILFAGIFIAYVQKYYAQTIKSWLGNFFINRSCAFISLFILMFIISPVKPWNKLFWEVISPGTLTGIAYVLLILWLLNYQSLFSRFLSSRVFLKFASLGYGMFLIHIPVLRYLVLPFIKNYYIAGSGMMELYWLIALFFTFVISVAGAYLLHIMVEKPFLYLRDKITS